MTMTSLQYSRQSFLRFCGVFLSSLIVTACLPTAKTNKNASLVIGLSYDTPPWGFELDSGELVGFEIDLVTAIAESLSIDIEFTDVPFIDLFPAVASGRIDVAMASITITDERLEIVDFSQPYYDSDLSLTARSNGDLKTLEDLAGKIIGADGGTTGEAWLEENREQYKVSELVRYEGNTLSAMDEIAAGRLDGYVMDIPVALYHSKSRPELKVVERILTGEQYGLMFAKGSPLRDEFNTVITALKENGTLAEIHKKWFGKAPEPTTSTVVVMPIPSL